MDQQAILLTRQSLHGIAEYVLAGPQYATSKDIRLRATPGGFGTTSAPELRVEGLDLVGPGIRLRLEGTFTSLAHAAGVEARTLRDVYSEGPSAEVDGRVVLDPDAVDLVHEAFAVGDAALRSFAPDLEPVLWPEHFDLGISLGHVNYGVSPGDRTIDRPYAYVGPWAPRRGAFWNEPFGAARPVEEFRDAEAVTQFFRLGAELAVSDPALD